MNPMTLNEFHDDPALQRRVYAQASRERALAARAAFGWLWRQAAGLAARMASALHPRPGRWIARLG